MTNNAPTVDRINENITGCGIGAFVNGLSNLSDFQSMTGKQLAVVLWYVHWTDAFPTSDADTVFNNGSVPLITWEPWITHELGTLEAIASGSYETYVNEFIQAAKDWGKPLFLRFAHEMNGNWYPWDGSHNGATAEAAERYKRAWVYIYNVRATLEADNIYLVWSPNNTNLPDASWNTIAAYYPGDQYVDWVGMDGYNWGYGNWQDFNAIFSSVYSNLTALTQKPLMIGEFASAEPGGSKADWITDALSQIKNNYPRVKIFCWFNIDKERDWRINSSSSAEAAFRQAIGDSYFVESLL
ncbi:MAG: glycosyl hydrolase [Candidatus Margulisiibacteriota bacterium]